MDQIRPQTQKKRYRLVFGRHIATDPETIHLPADRQRDKLFMAGSIIETEENLLKFNGKAGDARKFELINEDAADSPYTWNPSVETLEQFTQRTNKLHEGQSLTSPKHSAAP